MCAKTREPKDEHCVLWCTYTSNNICDPMPLDKLKNHTALPYITMLYYVLGWGPCDMGGNIGLSPG